MMLRSSVLTLLLQLALSSVSDAGILTFNATDDFSFTINTDQSAWSYRYATDLVRDGDYTLYTSVNPIADPFTSKPSVWNDGNDGFPAWVGRNTTGADQTSGGAGNWIWQAGDLMFHPGNGRLSVISWLAPEAGLATVDYSFADDITGGPVTWFVEKNDSATTLATASLASSATTGLLQLKTMVDAGDRLNFILDADGAIATDAIVFTAAISLDNSAVPEPNAVWFLCGLLLIMLVCRVCQRWLMTPLSAFRGLVSRNCQPNRETTTCVSAASAAVVGFQQGQSEYGPAERCVQSPG